MPSQEGKSISFNIPGIDGGMAPLNPNTFSRKERAKLDRIINAPLRISGRGLLGKTSVGFVVGALMAVLFFLLLMGVGILLGGNVGNVGGLGTFVQQHPLSWVIMLFIGFVISFVGCLVLMVFYTYLYSQKYKDIGSTTGLLLLTNLILAVGMVTVFLEMKDVGSQAPTVLLVFYVSLSLFISFCQIEFVANPNYAASAIMGNSVGFCVCLIVLGGLLAPNLKSNVSESSVQMLMLLTPLLAFPLMIIGQGIRDIIYGKIYDLGSNPFYIASRSELKTETLMEQEQQEYEQEKVPVDFN